MSVENFTCKWVEFQVNFRYSFGQRVINNCKALPAEEVSCTTVNPWEVCTTNSAHSPLQLNKSCIFFNWITAVWQYNFPTITYNDIESILFHINGIYWSLIMFDIPYSPDYEYQEICCHPPPPPPQAFDLALVCPGKQACYYVLYMF